MRTKAFNSLLPLLIALAVVLGLVQVDGFTIYASSFNDFSLSADGGVKASYDESTKLLLITGAGTIEHDKWMAMAQTINANYYQQMSYGILNSWRRDIDEDDMEIRFNGAEKAIKLYGWQDGWGMFECFSGQIHFNDAVDLAPTATKLKEMFYRAVQFNEPVDWNTSNITNINTVFAGATSFNQPLNWDTSNVTSMADVFSGATSFNQPLDWDTSNVTDMSYMFENASSFNQPISFDISKVHTAENAFINSAIESVVLDNIASNQNVDAINVFDNCNNLEYLEFSGLANAAIDGFSGDYYVEADGANPIAKQAYESYDFTDNLHYKIYLQASVPPAAPTVSLSEAGSSIKVAWSAVTGATGYQVFRADAAAGPYTLFKTTTGLSYTNSGALVPGMPYFYKVRAYRKNGTNYTFSDYSAVKGYYAPGALAKPAAPSLTLDENAGGIRLNWNAQPRITGYQIFRGVSTDKPFSYLKTTSGLAQVYTNLSGLNPGRPYYYKIRAYRTADGVTKYGDFSTIKGLFAGTNEPALNAVDFNLSKNDAVSVPNVRVTWSGVSGADGYCVYRWDSVHKTWIGLKATGPNARVYTNINGVVSGKTFFYGMRPLHISAGTTYYGNIGQAKGYKVP